MRKWRENILRIESKSRTGIIEKQWNEKREKVEKETLVGREKKKVSLCLVTLKTLPNKLFQIFYLNTFDNKLLYRLNSVTFM